jgi:hypothetical protein
MTNYNRRHVLRSAAAVAGGVAAGYGGPPLVGGTGDMALAAPAEAATSGGRYPFLQGAFAPVRKEVTAFDLPVTGRIPRELNGRTPSSTPMLANCTPSPTARCGTTSAISSWTKQAESPGRRRSRSPAAR